MTRKPLPLTAVRAFDMAARHLSFTKAAVELGMTQAAISYQIKLLEDHIGENLFFRRPRQVTLTPAGLHLAPLVSDAFERLASAFGELEKETLGTLVISLGHTFAANWLSARIGRFQIANPELAIRLQTSDQLVDFSGQVVDVAIRSGKGSWPGLTSHHLIEASFTPMLSPSLAESIGGVTEPADLLRLPIIDPDDPWWPLWLKAAGLDPDAVKNRQSSQLGAQILLANSAIAGNGVAILTPAFHTEALDTGRLIRPFDLTCNAGEAFYLVYPPARRNQPKIKRFREWILNEMSDMQFG